MTDQEHDPKDVWAFTDPNAHAVYASQGRLGQLEVDIRIEVMQWNPWQSEELDYLSEMGRLLREGLVSGSGTYWYRSPHPTVYRAQGEGIIRIASWVYPLHSGEILTFRSRIERSACRQDPGPVRLAWCLPRQTGTARGDALNRRNSQRPPVNGMFERVWPFVFQGPIAPLREQP